MTLNPSKEDCLVNAKELEDMRNEMSEIELILLKLDVTISFTPKAYRKLAG